ncbi:LURP-one-related/scramblase family protein [Streptococcus sp. sy004]|uniref:LURP-one-related/scramblase family protein n=1 Tax=Streptococcus sp. sy004 TaxID=2600149 RepID=UPI0011B653DB|nr:LURP-one-related family protein [Streptococcus sp. sy004]TWT12405.1 hypothetical protein FRX54_02465 [Streptococcus sp. sy004]
MKTFYIKEKMWSLGCDFKVEDETGQLAYRVKGSVFQWFKTFTFTNHKGRNVAKLKQGLSLILPKFNLTFADGRQVMIKKNWSWFGARYQIVGLDLSVEGDIWDKNYSLYKNGQLVAQIKQEWFKMTSTYQIKVHDESYSDEVVALAIVIDYIKERTAYSAVSS